MSKYEKIIELARRRGFFWPSFEIYGSVGGFIDFGPLGVVLKRRIEDKWREFFIKRHGFFEIETPIISPGKVFEASGHVEHFTDKIVECLSCRRKWRADHLIEEQTDIKNAERLKTDEMASIITSKIKCPECKGALSEPRDFNLMFKTSIGPYAERTDYGRPETAQAIFINFKRLYEFAREKLPFAAAQIGHCLRNEISPRQGPIRLREFTIMEFEFFFDPEESSCSLLKNVEDEVLNILTADAKLRGEQEAKSYTVKDALKSKIIANEWQAYFMALSKKFVVSLGISEDNQRFDEKLPWERAHYSVQTFDHEVYCEKWGWIEIAGHAYRTDYDLRMHMERSGVDMRVFKPYKEAIVRKRKVVEINKTAILRDFKDRAPSILKTLYSLKPEEIESKLAEKQLIVEGVRLDQKYVKIIEKEEREGGRRFLPHVVEPSFGADRLVYVTLEYAYSERNGRVVLRLPRELAPIQVAVFPLVQKDGLPELAKEVYRILLDEGFSVDYDESGFIGKRYARADEIGVPICATVDYRTKEDSTVTLRDRDTWKQVRNKIDVLPDLLSKYFKSKIEFQDLGEPVN